MPHWKKDPSAVLDWGFDWAPWLDAGETITTTTVTASGATVDSYDETEGFVRVWLSGGNARRVARVTCEVVTSEGRTDQRTMSITVEER